MSEAMMGMFNRGGKGGMGSANIRNLEARKAAGETLTPEEEKILKKKMAMMEAQKSQGA